MNPIVIHAQTGITPEDRGIHTNGASYDDRKIEWAAEGITVERHSYEYEGVTHEYDLATLVTEFAPVRPFSFGDLSNGIVATIGGQNYMIRVEIHGEGDDIEGGTPDGATVVFIPTSQPETPWTPFDEEAAKVEKITWLRRQLEGSDPAHLDDVDNRYLREIKELESGKQRLGPNTQVLLFGRPNFIQNPIFPASNGKVATCLMVLETGWGDCGNVNLLFTTDAEGRPNKVWFEASCC